MANVAIEMDMHKKLLILADENRKIITYLNVVNQRTKFLLKLLNPEVKQISKESNAHCIDELKKICDKFSDDSDMCYDSVEKLMTSFEMANHSLVKINQLQEHLLGCLSQIDKLKLGNEDKIYDYLKNVQEDQDAILGHLETFSKDLLTCVKNDALYISIICRLLREQSQLGDNAKKLPERDSMLFKDLGLLAQVKKYLQTVAYKKADVVAEKHIQMLMEVISSLQDFALIAKKNGALTKVIDQLNTPYIQLDLYGLIL